MYYLNIIISVLILLFFSTPSYAVFKQPQKIKYLNEKYESRVEERIKVEFFKTEDTSHTKRELLLKQLKELLDKDSKTI